MEILIIDDEEDICRLIAHHLKRMGIKSTYANSLQEGLHKFDTHQHKMIFLDINLPDGNGLDRVPDFVENNEGVKVIVISAYDSAKDRDRAIAQGASEFLKKPFSIQKIEEVVGHYFHA